MKQKTAHLSGEAIDTIEAALFSSITEANTELRQILAQPRSCELWVTRRENGLSALRELLSYAESRYLKPPGSAESMCALAARFFHQWG